MAKVEFPNLPQVAGMFTRLGNHYDYEWEPLHWKGIYNKVLLFDRCTVLTLELAKIEKGYVFPEHFHPTVQPQFLIAGHIRLKTGKLLAPGTLNIPPAAHLQ